MFSKNDDTKRKTQEIASLHILQISLDCKRWHNKYEDIENLNVENVIDTSLLIWDLKATPEMVTSAMQLYLTGESLRNVQKFLKLQGVKITHVSIYNWITKYVGLVKAYLEKITPNLADACAQTNCKSAEIPSIYSR
jgi:hypothetical protein